MQELTTITKSPRDSYFTSEYCYKLTQKTPRSLRPANFGKKMSWTLHEESLKRKNQVNTCRSKNKKQLGGICICQFIPLSRALFRLLLDIALLQVRVVILDIFGPIALVPPNCNVQPWLRNSIVVYHCCLFNVSSSNS